jgi:hypothetical protein
MKFDSIGIDAAAKDNQTSAPHPACGDRLARFPTESDKRI